MAEVEDEAETNEKAKPNGQSAVFQQKLHFPTLHIHSSPQTGAFLTSFSKKAGPKGQEGSLAENTVTMKAVRKRYEAQTERVSTHPLPGLNCTTPAQP